MNKARVARGALNSVLLSLIGVASLPVLADDPPPPLGWSGRGEAGLAMTSSNAGTHSSSYNAKLDFAYDTQYWKHAFGASGLYASSETAGTSGKTITDNRWEAHEQSDYKFSDKGFWFGGAHYEEDHVGSFAYQEAVTTGLGYKFYNSDRTKLAMQIGAGYKIFKVRAEPPDVSYRDHDLIGTATIDYQRALTATTLLIEKATVESGSSNTLATNDLGLQVKMSTLLAIALAYQVRYNSQPAVGFGHYDRLTTVNLVFKFRQAGANTGVQ